MTKYSGAWTPDMGEGDSEPHGNPLPASRFYSEQFDQARRREEEQARLESWMKGFVPRVSWETWRGDDGEPIDVLGVEFPTTPHFVGVYEHPTEHGRVMVWCFGCAVPDCGACRWAANIYRAEMKKKRARKLGDNLPF